MLPRAAREESMSSRWCKMLPGATLQESIASRSLTKCCQENVAFQGPSSGYLKRSQNQPRPSGPPWSGLAVLKKMIQMKRRDVVFMLTWMLMLLKLRLAWQPWLATKVTISSVKQPKKISACCLCCSFCELCGTWGH